MRRKISDGMLNETCYCMVRHHHWNNHKYYASNVAVVVLVHLPVRPEGICFWHMISFKPKLVLILLIWNWNFNWNCFQDIFFSCIKVFQSNWPIFLLSYSRSIAFQNYIGTIPNSFLTKTKFQFHCIIKHIWRK